MRGLTTSSAQLTALLFVTSFVPTLAMLGFMSYASVQTLASQRASLVTELRDELVAEYDGGGPSDLSDTIRDRLRYNPLGEEVMSYRSAKGKVLVGNVDTWPSGFGKRNHWLETTLQRSGDREGYAGRHSHQLARGYDDLLGVPTAGEEGTHLVADGPAVDVGADGPHRA